MPLIMNPPTYSTYKRLTHFTRLLDFHPTTGLCIRLLSFAPDYWALHPTTGLCTRRPGFAPDYWALKPDY